MKKYMIEQNGRSMIEMLGVLAIVGVLSVAGIAGYSKAMAKYKVNRVIDQVTMVAANLKTTFAGQGNYEGLTNAEIAYDLGVFPEEVVKDCIEVKEDGKTEEKYEDGCLRNGMGGTFAVKVSGSSSDYRASDSKYTFDLYVSGLSKDACATLLTADWGAASGLKDTLSIPNGTEDMAKKSSELAKAQPTAATSKIAAASASCNCGTSNFCAAGWRFY